MRTLLTILLILPTVATAQTYDDLMNGYRDAMGLPVERKERPVYGLPVQPVLPVPQDRGPWGTGYSIVTTTKPKRNIFDSDLTGEETVQRIVPNDALGQPMKGLDLGF